MKISQSFADHVSQLKSGAVDMAAVLVCVYRFLAAGERTGQVASLTASGGQARIGRFDR